MKFINIRELSTGTSLISLGAILLKKNNQILTGSVYGKAGDVIGAYLNEIFNMKYNTLILETAFLDSFYEKIPFKTEG